MIIKSQNPDKTHILCRPRGLRYTGREPSSLSIESQCNATWYTSDFNAIYEPLTVA